MYIVENEKEILFTQYEIPDFIGKKRVLRLNQRKRKDKIKIKQIQSPKKYKKRNNKNKNYKSSKQKNLINIIGLKKDKIKRKPKENNRKKRKKEKENKIDKKNGIVKEKEKKNNEITSNIEIILTSDQINEIGYAGELEVNCPFCDEELYFEFDNIDKKTLKATRACSNDHLIRISIQTLNYKIFSDLQVDKIKFSRVGKKKNSEQFDEYGNTIITYAIPFTLKN